MPARQIFQNSSTTDLTSGSDAPVTHVSLTFTPDDNSDYLIFWGIRMDSNTATQPTAGISQSGTFLQRTDISQDDNTDIILHSGWVVESFGASPGSQTYDVQFTRINDAADNSFIIALRLEDDDHFSTTQTFTATTTSTTFINAERLQFTPPEQKDYLILVSGIAGGQGGAGQFDARTTVGGTTIVEANRETENAGNDHNWSSINVENLTAVQQTIDWDVRSITGDTMTYGYSSVVALALDGFKEAFTAEDRTEETNSTGAAATHVSLTATPTSGDDLLFLGNVYVGGNSSGSITEVEFVQAGSNIPVAADIAHRSECQDVIDQFAVFQAHFISGGVSAETTWDIDYTDAAFDATAQYGAIAVLNLEDPGTGNNVAVGLASETDTAQQITAQRIVDVGLSSETDTAFDITPAAPSNVAVGLSTETDTAQPITIERRVDVGLASETDTAQTISPVTAGQVAVGQASETDTAQPITISRTLDVGIASETDTAQPISISAGLDVGLASETDTAQPITFRRELIVGLASELDTAFPIAALGTRFVGIGLASETDTAFPITSTGGVAVVTRDLGAGSGGATGRSSYAVVQDMIRRRREEEEELIMALLED